jgi:hypothetical protein
MPRKMIRHLRHNTLTMTSTETCSPLPPSQGCTPHCSCKASVTTSVRQRYGHFSDTLHTKTELIITRKCQTASTQPMQPSTHLKNRTAESFVGQTWSRLHLETFSTQCGISLSYMQSNSTSLDYNARPLGWGDFHPSKVPWFQAV